MLPDGTAPVLSLSEEPTFAALLERTRQQAGLPMLLSWLPDAIALELPDDAVRQVLTIGELGGSEAYAEAITTAAEEVGVEVNPRYGTWDGIQVVDQSGSISMPVDGLTQ